LKKEFHEILASARKTLVPAELEIYELRWHLGFTQVEMATILKKSERQIRRDIEKVLKKIRREFVNAGWNANDVQETGG